jgi:hypothetical protein
MAAQAVYAWPQQRPKGSEERPGGDNHVSQVPPGRDDVHALASVPELIAGAQAVDELRAVGMVIHREARRRITVDLRSDSVGAAKEIFAHAALKGEQGHAARRHAAVSARARSSSVRSSLNGGISSSRSIMVATPLKRAHAAL